MADQPVAITPALLRDWPLPPPGGDKESRGRVLAIGGTAHTPGAVLLAGEAVLRAGAGKLQIATAEPVAAAVAVAVPEALVVPVQTSRDGSLAPQAATQLLELAAEADAVLVGSGFSDPDRSVDLLAELVPHLDSPLVLDALASAFLTPHRDGVRHLSGRCMLSVNPTEVVKTLSGEDAEADDDADAAAPHRLSVQAGATVLCGGTTKTIAAPDGRLWSSAAGGPGLGVSGSGDVQAGLAAGLLGRGASAEQAAVWAAYLHGSAGDVLAERVGPVGLLAREIAGCIPALLDSLTE